MKRHGFSMIELIFIIIVLGILGGMMKMNMPDNRLLTDLNFITSQIKVKQIQALSYDNFDYKNSEFFDDKTCIIINKDSMNEHEKNTSKASPYQISPKTILSISDENICFDSLGRPYKLNIFVKMPIELNVTYKNRTKTINIMPYSGAVIVKK